MVILLDECRTEFFTSSRQYVKILPIRDLEKTIWKATEENRKRVILCNENFRKNINTIPNIWKFVLFQHDGVSCQTWKLTVNVKEKNFINFEIGETSPLI